jgi:hypothetical protein
MVFLKKEAVFKSTATFTQPSLVENFKANKMVKSVCYETQNSNS